MGVHAVFDSVSRERQRRAARKEAQRQKELRWMQEQQENVVYLEALASMGEDPTQIERQLGRMMTSLEFEQRLSKSVPNLYFEHNWWNPTKKALYQIRDGQKKYICAYENGWMPERSVIKVNTHQVPDPEVLFKGRKIDRADMPKGELTPDGHQYAEGTVRPGWKVIREPWGESKRGWRTPLLQLVKKGVATIHQVESAFGSDHTAQWAAHTGKRALPIHW